MNMIGCLDKPTSGEYLFNGINVENLNRNQMALLRRNFLGFVFQSFNLLGRTSALENVELPLVYRKVPLKQRKEMAFEALKKVGLESVVYNTPAQLSGGQQQRVAIARAIVSNPLVLLADEPTGNLDSIKSMEIMNLLKRLNEEEKITIIMVTHEEEMASFASRTIYFRDGHIEDSLKKDLNNVSKCLFNSHKRDKKKFVEVISYNSWNCKWSSFSNCDGNDWRWDNCKCATKYL